MIDLAHNMPEIDWGWHARDKVIAKTQWLDPDNMKAAGLMDRDLVLYFIWTHKLRSEVESTPMSTRLAAKLMCEPKSTAHDRLKRLEAAGLIIATENGKGSRPTSYGGNYSSDEYEAIIASACNAIKRAKEKALASGPRTGHNGSSVRPIDRTQTAKQPGHKDLASGADGLVSGEKPVVSGPIDRTTNTNTKQTVRDRACAREGERISTVAQGDGTVEDITERQERIRNRVESRFGPGGDVMVQNLTTYLDLGKKMRALELMEMWSATAGPLNVMEGIAEAIQSDERRHRRATRSGWVSGCVKHLMNKHDYRQMPRFVSEQEAYMQQLRREGL